MKKINLILLLFISIIGCNAQTHTVDITEQGTVSDLNYIPYGYYYKDINFVLNPFVGTYVYTDGNTSLKIIFQKKEMSSARGLYNQDLLIGEYQYIKDGVEKVNTLDRLNQNFADGVHYSIDGNSVIEYGDAGCGECGVDEKALRLGMVDRASDNVALLYVRRTTVGGQPAIKIFIWWQLKGVSDFANLIPASVPGNREFVLIKQ